MFIFGPIEFVAAMAIQEALLGSRYNPIQQVLSNLGVSPYSYFFNGSIIILGIVTFLGVILTFRMFPRKITSGVGRIMLLFAGLGAIGVGIFTEHTRPHSFHGIFAAVAFLSSGIALIFLANSFRKLPEWAGWPLPTAFGGVFTIAALILFAVYNGYDGLTERLIVVPILAWAPMLGWHFWQRLNREATIPPPPTTPPAPVPSS